MVIFGTENRARHPGSNPVEAAYLGADPVTWLLMLKIRRRLLRWGLLALGLPLAARILHSAADMLESRQGVTPAVRNLHRAGGAVEAVQDSVRGRSRKKGTAGATTPASSRDRGSAG